MNSINKKFIGQRERLTEVTVLGIYTDVIVRSYGNMNHEKLAEMTSSTCNKVSNNSAVYSNKIRIGSSQRPGVNNDSVNRPLSVGRQMRKFSLIGLNPEMGTRRNLMNSTNRINHQNRERLNEKTSYMDDVIVRSCRNYNCKKSAEMTDSFCIQKRNISGRPFGCPNYPLNLILNLIETLTLYNNSGGNFQSEKVQTCIIQMQMQ